MQRSKVARNAWLPLLIVAVMVVGGFAVARVKSFFGAESAAPVTSARVDNSKPFKPKVVKYEIFGSASRANVNYLDLSADPVRVDDAPLPWTLVLSTTAPRCFRTCRHKAMVIASVAASPSITKSRPRKYPPACTP